MTGLARRLYGAWRDRESRRHRLADLAETDRRRAAADAARHATALALDAARALEQGERNHAAELLDLARREVRQARALDAQSAATEWGRR